MLIASGKTDALAQVVKLEPGADLQATLADAVARGPQTPAESAPTTTVSHDPVQAAAQQASSTAAAKPRSRRGTH